MGLYRHPYNNEQREASGAVASFLINKGWTEVVPPEVIEEQAEAAAEELKGADLDDALRANGLPLTGKVAEKRERLAEHLAKAGTFGYPDEYPASALPFKVVLQADGEEDFQTVMAAADEDGAEQLAIQHLVNTVGQENADRYATASIEQVTGPPTVPSQDQQPNNDAPEEQS
ncbi:SAP domain-containing protein [Aeromicrobium sp. 9AM]|uniref:SAP domain-containing protein n=1 Tax=Aeromicrobium sp. 9AM TaxID=2653126 RepID=UPI0012EF95F7|nr:SAP domain-containing protein [Aeromicrobium sp. 9AM]VXB81945.1 hypothetical protein AERO9AM_20982 [Aeromicrobium sp. 9AM]